MSLFIGITSKVSDFYNSLAISIELTHYGIPVVLISQKLLEHIVHELDNCSIILNRREVSGMTVYQKAKQKNIFLMEYDSDLLVNIDYSLSQISINNKIKDTYQLMNIKANELEKLNIRSNFLGDYCNTTIGQIGHTIFQDYLESVRVVYGKYFVLELNNFTRLSRESSLSSQKSNDSDFEKYEKEVFEHIKKILKQNQEFIFFANSQTGSLLRKFNYFPCNVIYKNNYDLEILILGAKYVFSNGGILAFKSIVSGINVVTLKSPYNMPYWLLDNSHLSYKKEFKEIQTSNLSAQRFIESIWKFKTKISASIAILINDICDPITVDQSISTLKTQIVKNSGCYDDGINKQVVQAILDYYAQPFDSSSVMLQWQKYGYLPITP